MQKIIETAHLANDLAMQLESLRYDKLIVLTDKNTIELCFPLLKSVLPSSEVITIEAGDDAKSLDSLAYIWKRLSDLNASRHSLLINLGGGMITDIGGFAAATFKRGIRFINIPTTLLGAVDAAVGGKTGINLNGLKNEVGAFAPAEQVFIYSEFFKTLSETSFMSGYAEMLKQALLDSDVYWNQLLCFDMDNLDYGVLNNLIVHSISIKQDFVEKDPFENGIRKALNFGHTIGHAFESLSHELGKPVEHGIAVAWGLVCELYLSEYLLHFPKDKLYKTVYFIKEYYGDFIFNCDHYERLYEYMKHDKKNQSGIVNFTLLADIGEIHVNQSADQNLIFESIDFLRESVGL